MNRLANGGLRVRSYPGQVIMLFFFLCLCEEYQDNLPGRMNSLDFRFVHGLGISRHEVRYTDHCSTGGSSQWHCEVRTSKGWGGAGIQGDQVRIRWSRFARVKSCKRSFLAD